MYSLDLEVWEYQIASEFQKNSPYNLGIQFLYFLPHSQLLLSEEIQKNKIYCIYFCSYILPSFKILSQFTWNHFSLILRWTYLGPLVRACSPFWVFIFPCHFLFYIISPTLDFKEKMNYTFPFYSLQCTWLSNTVGGAPVCKMQ